MRLVILEDSNKVAEWSAKYVLKRINDFKPLPDKYFVLGLPTGLPRDHPESYHFYMWNNIDPRNAHLLNGNAPNLEEECESFERKISEAGGINLFVGGGRERWATSTRKLLYQQGYSDCTGTFVGLGVVNYALRRVVVKSYGKAILSKHRLGLDTVAMATSIGPDGHIAFNEPGSSLVSRTRVKTLAQDTLEANARFFGNDISKVPKQALTVGVGTVMDAEEVMILITGAHKAFALYKAIEEGVNHMWTVSAFQQHRHTIMICDEDATLELRVKTVKYFKALSEVHQRLIEEDMPAKE
uniref:Glucosamine-6-phosphate deaminase n=1 Tax=Timema shepardi TaxID=629360 RepID=A0A7R9AZD3_TIMSH|nr:unnamed protein product [Timema shepardi]